MVRGPEGRGQRGSKACVQVNLRPEARCTVVRRSGSVTSPRGARRVVEGPA